MTYQKALVTGGAGFIGSHIVERLVSQGVATISLDNYVTGKNENLTHLRKFPLLEAVRCDVTDRKRLEKYIKQADIIFHNAASKKTVCLKDPRMDLRTNAEGTFNIMDLARRHGVKKIVVASTGSVYGEAQYFPQDEKHPLNPTSYYGISKLAGERYAMVFHRLYGMDVTVLRYFHVYGPRQEYSDVGGVVSIFARRIAQNQPLVIFGDGTQQRSFTYVGDVVDINMMAAENPEMQGQCYNCASGIKVTIQELADKLREKFDAPRTPIEYKDWVLGDIKVFDVDNTKLKSLGFEFRTSFDQGLSKTIEWIKDYFRQSKGAGHV